MSKRASLVAFATVAVSLAALATFELLRTESGPPVVVLPDEEPDAEPPESLVKFMAAMSQEHPPAEAAPLPPSSEGEARGSAPGSEDIGVVEARRSFRHAMERLDTLADERRSLSRKEWKAINRWANNAYTALSVPLDPREPGDRQLLEDARLQLLDRLAMLQGRVRPPKRRR